MSVRRCLFALCSAASLTACGSKPSTGAAEPPSVPADATGTAITAPTSEPTADPQPAQHPAAHFSYSGEHGPDRWGDLSKDWALCKTGKAQSPIDIPKDAATDTKLPAVELKYETMPVAVLNNGHTVKLPNPTESSLMLAGETYRLVQLHFHTPSEHTVAGKLLDMELHLVHSNDKGELAVVGILFRKGKENALLAPIWKSLPTEVGESATPLAGVTLDLAKLLPARRSYYSYAGSLTTPPCSEGVKWLVLSTVLEASAEQVDAYTTLMQGPTNRPVMPLEGRAVVVRK